MDKEEQLYRLNKAHNILVGYTTLPDKDRLKRAAEEVSKVITSMVEETNN